MEKEELKALIKRYLTNQATEEDMAFLDNAYLDYYNNQVIEVSPADYLSAAIRVKKNLDREHKRSKQKVLWPKTAAVAATALCVVSFGLYCYNKLTKQEKIVQPVNVNIIQPGSNKAVLVLSNGKRISLSDAKNGMLASQSGIEISKVAAGKLVYTATDASSSTGEYNTIEIPKGGNYQIYLPDGTKVWLNAASTLKYPIAFTSLKERKVQLLGGEAYFEVAHEAIPFRVGIANHEVEVLGTHFNINAYPEETIIKTTLLAGSVRVDHKTILKPGEQAINSHSGITVKKVDVDTVVDWKEGGFSFNKGDDFKTDMRKIERWYDVEFVYHSTVLPKMDLGGWVPRDKNITTILNQIEATGKVHFKIEGRRIIVTK